MNKTIVWILMAGLVVSFALTAPAVAADRQPDRWGEAIHEKLSSHPLTVKLSSPQVHVGESIWLTINGGVQPYVLIAADNNIRSVSRGKNTYQLSGLAAGSSRLTIKDSENNTVSITITVLPKR